MISIEKIFINRFFLKRIPKNPNKMVATTKASNTARVGGVRRTGYAQGWIEFNDSTVIAYSLEYPPAEKA
jgi:hypothetical protein